MAYTTIDDPEAHFQTQLYTGNGGTQSITLGADTDMQPDLVWGKQRTDSGANWFMFDAVRGTADLLESDTTAVTDTNATSLTAFNSDGFSLGAYAQSNENAKTMVSYNWKAGGGSGSSNTDGSINTTSTSVNTTSKCSISTYTGTGSTATVGHGLGVTPSLIITKSRGGTFEWAVYHHKMASDPETDYLYLNTTAAVTDDVNIWNDTAPTSTVFTVETSNRTNASSGTYVAYVWADVQGYSKFGSYTGNGNADGTFVYTGFKPAWVMIKGANVANSWRVFDNKRLGYNVDNNALSADATAAEATSDLIDILSNGFKFRSTDDSVNGAYTYVYMAFAEAPFVNSEGVPCNAR